MRTSFALAGQACNPVNRKDIVLEINHDQGAIVNQPLPHVGIRNLVFGREDEAKMMSLLNQAPGITEGIPFDITVDERGQAEVINMYIKCMDGFKRSRQGITASVKMVNSVDHLDDLSRSFTLESLYNDTTVYNFKIDGINYATFQEYFDKRCIFIPYVLSSIPNRSDAFTAIFSITYVIIELQKSIKFVVQWATPIPDGAGGAFAIGQLIAEIVFIALLLAALIVLIIHLFQCLIQPVKYHGAMLVVDMLKIISFKCGLNFNSSVWEKYPYNQIAYLPQKYNPVAEANPQANVVFGISFSGFAKTGFTSPGYAVAGQTHNSMTGYVQKGYYDGLGGDFLRFSKNFINGKIIIPNQTTDLSMERRDNYPASSLYQLQDVRQDWNGYNTDELDATIMVRFLDDLNDKNCIDKYIGTILQATHQQIITNSSILNNLKGLRTIQIEAARGVMKTDLNMIESVHLVLQVAFNQLQNDGITLINATIELFNIAIEIVNIIIKVWNALMQIIVDIINVIGNIISAIGSLFGNHTGIGTFTGHLLTITPINKINPLTLVPLIPASYGQRIGALLLENDMVTRPKILMIDTARAEFNAPGGYSGKQRIGYLHRDNAKVINAKWLWDNFYNIDAFVGSVNNRFTKIVPSLNKDTDINPVTLSVADFKNLVSNPKFKDNFAEEVIAESIQWRIGDDSGRAEMQFRKAGWLRDPQSQKGSVRAQEININLQINTSIPNGQ